MSNISFDYEKNQEFLKRFGLDKISIIKYKSGIYEVSEATAAANAWELNRTICNPVSREDAYSLIKHGANVNKSDYYGDTPLINCMKNGEFNIALELIKAGANVNLPNSKMETPLMVVASLIEGGKAGSIVSKTDLVKILILMGADINAKNKKGETALMLATSSKNDDICKILKATEISNSITGVLLPNLNPLVETVINDNLATESDAKSLLDEASLELEKIKRFSIKK